MPDPLTPHSNPIARRPAAASTPATPATLLVLVAALAGCAQLPRTGPTTKAVEQSVDAPVQTGAIQLVDVDETVARRLAANQVQAGFAETLGDRPAPAVAIGRGDTIEIGIWETPPAMLFGNAVADPRIVSTASPTTLPTQQVDHDGMISVPFAGRLKAVGLTPTQLSAAIRDALKGKANQPQVMVRVAGNASATVTVVGEVGNNLRMPVTPAGERLLDAIAAAGGVKQPLNKVTVQVTRGDQLRAMPLEQVVRDPRQNIHLQPGDVVAALFQPLSFVALGATGRQDEIAFEAQGITLAQALGRIGGLNDARSDVRGVFVFRFERRDAIEWPRQPVQATPDGQVPVVYRIDLGNPTSFFAMQSFPVHHRDVVFVSTSPVADLQKILSLASLTLYPALNLYRTLD